MNNSDRRTNVKGSRSKEGPGPMTQGRPSASSLAPGRIRYAKGSNGENGSSWELREDDSGQTEHQVFNLLERTAVFGESVIRFAKKIPRNPVNDRLTSQLVGAGTSVGANYCEADDAVSKKDFKNRIGICRKEAKECKFWLRMIANAEEPLKAEKRQLWKDAAELHLIFCATFRKC